MRFVRVCAREIESEIIVHEGPLSAMIWGSDPLFKADYILKRKSEHPQRGSDRGRYWDLETEKRESQSFHFKPVIFFRLPVPSSLSLSLADTHRHMHAHPH